MPASNNFKLNNFGFGNGGTNTSTSTSYNLQGIAGETNGSAGAGSTVNSKPGFIETEQANVPIITLSNPSNYYNKLKFVIDQQNNPSDALYALAISTDNFATTNYIKSDNTIGSTLTLADYQTYATWGGASGGLVIGLTPNTTYYVKAKATQGKFTESGYGPVSSAATVAQQLSFDIDVSPTDSDTSPPYATNIGTITQNVITTSTDRIWVDFQTNAEKGGKVYGSATNAGLHSATVSYTIAAVTGDLASLTEGYGIQSASATQSAGGPIAAVSPYNGSSGSVGLVNTILSIIYQTSNPITAGRASFVIKAKSKALTPPASDYTETMRLIAAGSF
ncbi:MAG TPA: hypothetical protein VLF41_02915 [Candidatus Nanoarchaeia archaeon]|nr:hypothetical protein [Candidatus Nanoarchaeia archaeon]